MRDGVWPEKALEQARSDFLEFGDLANAVYLRLLEARRAILHGRLEEASRALDAPVAVRSATLDAVRQLLRAHIALREVRPADARRLLTNALAGLPAEGFADLRAEFERALALLVAPVARQRTDTALQLVTLDDLAAFEARDALVVDATRFEARCAGRSISLASRPILFALLRALAEAWPGDSRRADVIRTAFGGQQADESHRARLRVEMARLRRALDGLGGVTATPEGYRLCAAASCGVVLIEPLVDTRHSGLLALLSDGEAWTSGALAKAMATGQRSVQRWLEALAEARLVQPEGRGRARRWRLHTPDPFETSFLLAASAAL
jgi:hypothetical protein